MRGKTIVCRCEDVTLHDVEHAIALGYSDIESVKRYTGFGTGPCQGKECLAVVARVMVERTGQDPADMLPFTSRQPIAPTPLALFAGVSDELLLPDVSDNSDVPDNSGVPDVTDNNGDS